MRRIASLMLLLGLTLPPVSTQAQAVSDSDFIWMAPAITEITDQTADTNFHVAVMIDNAMVAGAVSVPLVFAGHNTLNIDTTVAMYMGVYGVTFGAAGRKTVWTIRSPLIDNDAKTILISLISFTTGLPSVRDTLCYVHFDLDGSIEYNSVSLDTTSVPPANRLYLYDLEGTPYTPGWISGEIRIGPKRPIGDVNCDGVVSAADIIWLINFVFKGSDPPPVYCP